MPSAFSTLNSIAALCVFAATGAAQTRTESAPITGALAARLDSIADTFRREQGLPGIAFSVVTTRGQVLYERGVGLADIAERRPVTSRTLFPIYSVSKVYTSATAHHLASGGKLDLTAVVGRYLDGLPSWRDTITIRQLLAHTAGLFEYSDIEGYQASASAGRSEDHRFFAMAVQRPLRFPPGTSWEYSNTGYALAQLAIERVTNDSLSHTLTKEFLEPLGLHETSPACPPQDLATGYTEAWRLGLPGDSIVASAARNAHRMNLAAGGLCSTAPDMARFVAALVAGRVVTADALADMTRRELAVAPSGAGLFVTEDSEGLIYAHSGGGGNGNSEVMAFVRDSLVFAALTNTGGANLDRLLRVLRREVVGLPQPVVQDLPTSPDEWFPFVGSYFEPATRNRLAILVDQGGQPFMFGGRLQRQADGSFVPNRYRDWRVAFHRLPDGTAEMVVREYGVITRRGIRRP